MKKLDRKTQLIIAGSIVAAITIAIILRRRKKSKQIKEIEDILSGEKKDPSETGSKKTISKEDADKLPAGTWPIKIGEPANKKILELQRNINRNYGKSLDEDGKYGTSTYDFMCDNIWSSWYKVGECRDWSGNRRSITQEDFDTVKKHRQSSTFDGTSSNNNVRVIKL